MAQDRAQRQDAFDQGAAGGARDGGVMNDLSPGAPPAGGGTYFLGRYRVVDEIGIGGMASVHLARMDGPGGFQRWAAIKKIHSHLIEDDSFIQMFLDEAQVAARISHPNVAQVFDLGKTEDTYWIAMEYLHGEPLREVMRRTEEVGTAMPPEIACKVIADAAEGLHAAHDLTGKNGEQLNLVHRDVTPHNLFVTYDGITKVLDFGIAKFSLRAAHTKAGTLKGKLAYMSPEQVHGEQLDRRTDVFALGVVLWELTTGRRLFRMESDLDTLAKVQECDVPRPSALIRGYPIDLEKIVMKALAKNRADRFKTAKEFSRSLQQLLMRRGLFIASDEVAQYVAALFQDRMKKRDEHLKWASEVTQTANVDGSPPLAAVPKSTSRERESSDVQNRGASAKPLPAAGAPAARAAVDVGSGRSSHAGYQGAIGSAPAPQPLPPRPSPQPAPPKPAAASPQAQIIHDVHPADADGPTIQADVSEVNDSGPGEEPATMMAPPPRSTQGGDAPNAPPRPAAHSRGPAEPASLSNIPNLEDEPFEEQEDATIVQMGSTSGGPSTPSFPAAGAVSRPTGPGGFAPAGPIAPQGGPSTQPPPPLPNPKMTMPLDASPFEPKSPPLFGGATMALGASANPAFVAGGNGPSPIGPSGPGTSPYDFSPNGGGPGGQMPGPGPMQPMQSSGGPMMSPFGPQGPMGGQQQQMMQMPPLPAAGAGNAPFDFGPAPMGGSPGMAQPQQGMHPQQGMEFANGTAPMQYSPNPSRMAPTMPALRSDGTGGGVGSVSMAQPKRKGGAPMWVVAAISCAAVLLIVAIALAIFSKGNGSSTTPAKTEPSASTSAGASDPQGAPSTAPVPPDPGAPTPTVVAPAETAQPAPPTAPTTPTPPPTTQPVPATAKPGPAPGPGPLVGPTPGPTPIASVKPAASGPGQLTVVCLPKCEEVRLDGALIGTGNVYNKEVAAGNHQVSRSAGGKKQVVSITIKPGETKEIRGSL